MAANFFILWAMLTKPHSVFTFSRPRKVESAEAHIVFDDSKDRLHFGGALRPQALARLHW